MGTSNSKPHQKAIIGRAPLIPKFASEVAAIAPRTSESEHYGIAGGNCLRLDVAGVWGDIMKKIISVVAVAVALTAVLPAASAQQADPPKPTLTAKLKQKYQERRAKFMHRVKDVYFAVGCKVLAGGAGIQPLTSNDSYLAFVGDQTIVDLKDDEALRQAAMQQGLERAAKPGECDYYRRHPEAAVALRRAAADAARK